MGLYEDPAWDVDPKWAWLRRMKQNPYYRPSLVGSVVGGTAKPESNKKGSVMARSTSPAWTSLEAYKELRERLPGKLRKTICYLTDFVNRVRMHPTARELEEFIKAYGEPEDRLGYIHFHSFLPKLADRFTAAHRGEARTCGVTGKSPVFTWVPGPPPGFEHLFGKKNYLGVKYEKLEARFRKLVSLTGRTLNQKTAAFILDAKVEELEQYYREEVVTRADNSTEADFAMPEREFEDDDFGFR